MSVLTSVLATIFSLLFPFNADNVDTAHSAQSVSTENIVHTAYAENTNQENVSIVQASSSSTPEGVSTCVETTSNENHLVLRAIDSLGNSIVPETIENIDNNGNNVQLNCFDLEKGAHVLSVEVTDNQAEVPYALNI